MTSINKLLIAAALGLAMSNPAMPDAWLVRGGVPETSKRKTGAAKAKRQAKKRRNRK